jgi:hypothetical protein
MIEPDEDPAIATLLDDAAELAAAANAKLGEALAIAEQTRRDAGFNATPAAAITRASPPRKKSRTYTVAAHGRRAGRSIRPASFTPSSSMGRPLGSKRSTSSCRRRSGSQGRTSSNACGEARRDRSPGLRGGQGGE